MRCLYQNVRPFARATPSPFAVRKRKLTVVVGAGLGFGNPNQTSSSENKLALGQGACPCGSGLPYKACCKVYHDGKELPESAEALMRSRYSAYAKKLVKYIVETTHPENPLAKSTTDNTSPSALEKDVKATCDKINWEKLKVLECRDGSSANEAYVTFQTYFKVGGQKGQRAQGWYTQSFVEDSRFLKEDGKWLYVDGTQEWKA
jgi:SEC-C motif-containing protein